jgi:hypothetical protein
MTWSRQVLSGCMSSCTKRQLPLSSYRPAHDLSGSCFTPSSFAWMRSCSQLTPSSKSVVTESSSQGVSTLSTGMSQRRDALIHMSSPLCIQLEWVDAGGGDVFGAEALAASPESVITCSNRHHETPEVQPEHY